MTDGIKKKALETSEIDEDALFEELAFEDDDVGEEADTEHASFEHGDAWPTLAYVKPISREAIRDQLPTDAPDGPYYALHDEDGRPLALFTDRTAAFVAARSNNYSPVAVH